MEKQYITLSLEELVPYENNPRLNDDAVADVAESIKQTGNNDPIEIDENNVILSGHTRLKALKQLGYTQTECLRISGMTEEQKRKYRILANKTAEKADWDLVKLEQELAELDFDGYDFDFDRLEKESEETITENDNSNSFNYVEQYGVIVMCENELHQEQVYNKLSGEGYNCKVVTT